MTWLDRLTMFSSAQARQFGLRHCSGMWLSFCVFLLQSLKDGLFALLERLGVII